MWAARPDLKLLTTKEAQDHVNKTKKTSSLTEAYSVAMNPPDLETVEREIREAATAAAAAAAAAEEEEEEEEAEEEEEEADEEIEEEPKSRKRKSRASTNKETPQKKRATTSSTRKTSSRRTKKNDSDIFDPDNEMVDADPTINKRESRRSASGRASSSNNGSSSGDGASGSKRKGQQQDSSSGAPPNKRAKSKDSKESSGSSGNTIVGKLGENLPPDVAERAKNVRALRHRLHRQFINTKLNSEDIAQLSQYLNRLEELPEIEPFIIRANKFKKVLSAISKNELPDEEKYNIRNRINTLIRNWNERDEQCNPESNVDGNANGAKEKTSTPEAS